MVEDPCLTTKNVESLLTKYLVRELVGDDSASFSWQKRRAHVSLTTENPIGWQQ